MAKVKWSADIAIPTDSGYTAQITEASFGPSKSSGNPMITIKSELCAPESVMVGDKEVSIAGVPLRALYFTTKVLDGNAVVEDKTANARERVFVSSDPDKPSLWEKLGLDGSKEDPENPNVKQLIGMKILVQCSSKEDAQRKTPNAEQIAKAKANKSRAEGDIMTHPVTGKKLVKFWPEIDEVFAVAPSGTGSAY